MELEERDEVSFNPSVTSRIEFPPANLDKNNKNSWLHIISNLV